MLLLLRPMILITSAAERGADGANCPGPQGPRGLIKANASRHEGPNKVHEQHFSIFNF